MVIILYLRYMEEKKPSEKHKRPLKYEPDNSYPWESGALEEKEKIHESSDKVLAKRKLEKLEEAAEFVYGKSLKWYKEVALWPMFILLVVELGVRVMQTKYFFLWPAHVFNWIITIARVALFIYLAVIAVRQFKADKMQTVTAAMIGGAVVGFIVAIFQLFWYFELWTFFNLIGQPLLLAAIGAIISWLVYTLVLGRISNKK